MDLRVKFSDSMKGTQHENHLIRMPETLRRSIGKNIGDLIYLNDRHFGVRTLQVADLLQAGDSTDTDYGIVTKEVYDSLLLREKRFNELIPVDDITLGCDPEAFLLERKSNNLLAANRFMGKYGDVGNDGLLLEFRPTPSADENDVVRTIANLIRKARNILNKKKGNSEIEIVGASGMRGATAGFHLHYGLPKQLLGVSTNTANLARLMTKAFDYYVGVPSIIPEGDYDIIRRTLKFVGYGKPGGYRLGNRTFEYRLPGGINLRHPTLARGLMALGAVVAEDVVSRIRMSTDFFFNLREISDVDMQVMYPNLPNNETLYATICSPVIGPAKGQFEIIKGDIRKMIGYSKRAKSVEEYFDVLDNDIRYDYNIEKNWGGFIG